MSLRLREVPLELDEGEDRLPARVAELLGIAPQALRRLRVVRRGIDARKKPRIRQVFTVEFDVDDEPALLGRHAHNPRLEAAPTPAPLPALVLSRAVPVTVVGMGPAGLFAALRLAEAGAAVTLVERGRPVQERTRDVARFWDGHGLDPESNLQFGEGGAGTFSDGKLTTRINHPGIRHVLETLVACGAPERILTDAKPHLGTDRLREVLVGIRQRLTRAGVTIWFGSRLTGLELDAGPRPRVRAAVLDDREAVPCDALVLAPGHSARDTYQMLHHRGVALSPKAFALGVRVEHPAALIHQIQYGRGPHPRLPTPDYRLAWTDRDTGRGCYSFCMCPGGQVVIASSEPGGVVVNGMSHGDRAGDHSNAALVVAVRPEDLDGDDALAGVRWQRRYEEAAFAAGGRDYRAPAQNLLAFLQQGTGPVQATCRPGVTEADLAACLPGFVTAGLRRALPRFDQRLRGFVTREAVLVGVESRTSAPLRILRDEDGQSVSHPGLFPAGEGSGYAGGIVSSAVDGLRAAEHVATGPGAGRAG